MPRDPLEDSGGDETQLNDLHRRVRRLEASMDSSEGAQRGDHEAIVRLQEQLSAYKEATTGEMIASSSQRKEERKMRWDLILLALTMLGSGASFIVNLLHGAK